MLGLHCLTDTVFKPVTKISELAPLYVVLHPSYEVGVDGDAFSYFHGTQSMGDDFISAYAQIYGDLTQRYAQM
jgi:hypothetical protein